MNWRDIWYDAETGKLRCGWRVAAFFAVAFLATVLLELFLALPALLAIKDPQENTQRVYQAIADILPLASALGYLLAGIWALRTFEGLPPFTLGLSPRGPWFSLLLGGFGFGIALVALLSLLLCSLGFATFSWHVLAPAAGVSLLTLAGKFLLIGAMKELLFHGYLFQTLLRSIGPLVSLLAVSLFGTLFATVGAPDMTPVLAANIFLMFNLLGMLYLRFGTLWGPIGLNAGWTFGLILFHIPTRFFTEKVSTPFTVTLNGPSWLLGDSVGPEAGVAVSTILLGAIALITHMRYGLSLSSYWWMWRELTLPRRRLLAWDFSIGSRAYQWKLSTRDLSE